jgi:hypothetical protein
MAASRLALVTMVCAWSAGIPFVEDGATMIARFAGG